MARILSAAFLALFVVGCDAFFVPSDNENDNSDQDVTDDVDDGLNGDATPLYVNIQIDAEMEDVDGLARIVDELLARSIRTTVFVTADYANRQALRVHDLYQQEFEIALHGYYTGEQLASMNYEEQQDLLGRALLALQGCKPCGTFSEIVGFRPQYFSQNEDTYRVLDEMSIRYNCGFKAEQIFVEGHEEDAHPYSVDGYAFHAVPMTTIEYNGKGIYLCDIACANVEEMTAAQWSEALSMGLRQAIEREEPLVALFHGWYTGDTETYDYWEPFVGLLDEVTAHGGVFVTTNELVDLYGD